MVARSSLLRRIAALAALAPRLVRLAHHEYSDRLLDAAERALAGAGGGGERGAGGRGGRWRRGGLAPGPAARRVLRAAGRPPRWPAPPRRGPRARCPGR